MPRRVLVVEDAPGIGGALRDLLIDEGYGVDLTPSGLDGLVRAARNSYDAALLDIEVEDLCGLGVTRAVADFSDVPVIVMSARMGPWQREAFRAGAIACLPKPFGADEVLALLRSTFQAQERVGRWAGDVRELEPQDLEALARLTPAEVDRLPFGAMRVDPQGRVTLYNAYEGDVARLIPQSVVGLPFERVAPCARVRRFLGAIDEGFEKRNLDRVIRFVFPHRSARSVVSVRLWYDAISGQVWLFVSKRATENLPKSPR